MAGLVRSRKMPIQFLSFWQIFVFASFFTIIIAGCTNQQPVSGYVAPLTPAQKKEQLLESLKRDSEDSQTHFMLGQLYHQDKEWDEAEIQYKLAWQYDPVYWPAQAALIKLELDRGDPGKARNYFDLFMKPILMKQESRQVKQVIEAANNLIDLGVECQQQQLDTYAMECLQKALDIAPNSPITNKYMGYYYLYKNDKAKAKEYFEKSFNLDRLQGDVALELGRLEVPIEYPPADINESSEE